MRVTMNKLRKETFPLGMLAPVDVDWAWTKTTNHKDIYSGRDNEGYTLYFTTPKTGSMKWFFPQIWPTPKSALAAVLSARTTHWDTPTNLIVEFAVIAWWVAYTTYNTPSGFNLDGFSITYIEATDPRDIPNKRYTVTFPDGTQLTAHFALTACRMIVEHLKDQWDKA